MGERLRYAWHGSGPKWAAGPMQAIGGCLGGLLFWALGLKLPQAILDNPALSGVFAIVLGGVSGVAFVFFLRLLYWPIHRRAEPRGGLLAALRKRLGTQMGPAILMASGLLAFLVLFGGGAIWAVVQSGERKHEEAGRPLGEAFTAYEIGRRLQAIDEIRDLVGVPTRALSDEGRGLHTKIESGVQLGAVDGSNAEILRGYAKRVESLLKQMQATAAKYAGYEFIREFENFNAFNPFEVVSSAWNVAAVFQQGPPATSGIRDNQYFVAFGRSTIQLGNWSGDWANKLEALRKDVLALPVAQSK